MGVTGDDEAGRRLRALLAEEGVEGRGLVVTTSSPTNVEMRLLAGHSQIARFDEEAILDGAD